MGAEAQRRIVLPDGTDPGRDGAGVCAGTV